MLKRIIIASLGTMLALGSAVFAMQERQPSVHGRIVDASNKPVANFKLVARRTGSTAEFMTVTNENGEFNFAELPAGTYFLQNPAAPAANQSSPTVSVEPGTSRDLNLQTDPSGKIEYPAQTHIPSTASAAIRNEYTEEPVQLLPQANALSRTGEYYGAYNLSLLGEGTTPGSILQPGVGPSVAGRPNATNNFEISGADNNNPAIGGPLLTISNEAVTNLTVEQGEAASRLAPSSGGQSNVILTQGTNLWHGGFYEYLNTRGLNAVEPALAGSSERRHRYDQSRMGMSLGGPIVANKLFVFGNFEYLPLRAKRPELGPIFAPTAQGYALAAGAPGVSATNLGVLQNTVGAAQIATSTALVNGVPIPIGALNADVQTSQDQFNGLLNIDWQKGTTSKLSARYGHNDYSTTAFGSTLPQFQVFGYKRALFGQLNYTGVVGSGTTVSANASYHRLDQTVHSSNFTFPGLTAFPNINIQDLGLQLGSTVPANRIRSNVYQAGTWAEYAVHGHRIRAGVDVRYLESIFQNMSAEAGNYSFSSLNRFLLDLSPDAGGQRTFGGDSYVGSRTIWNGFIEDKLRLRNVSVEMGIAYQYSQIPISLRNQGSLSALSVPGVITFGKPKSDDKNFAPHIAIAFSPGSERTVIRSGFGMMYDALNNSSWLLGPEMAVSTVRNTSSLTPGFFAAGGAPIPTTGAGGVGVYTGNTSLPYIMEWSAGVSQSIFTNLTAEVKYVGNHGVHQPVQTVLNNPSGVTASFNLPVYFTNPGPAVINSLGLTQQILASQTNAFTANGFTNPILSSSNDGSSWYNAAILKLNDRFSGGSQITGQYTYTDARADSTGTALDLFYGRRMEQSIWTRKHRATLSPVFEVSSVANNWPGRLKSAVNSLSILATLTYESGANIPLFGGAGTGITGVPEGTGVFVNPSGVPGSASGVVPLNNSTGQTVAFLATNPNAQYVAGAPGTFSTDRPMMRLAQTRNVDLAVMKRFAIGHWGRLETRADAFNLFNRAQFTGMPISTLGSGAGLAVPSYLFVSNPEFNNSHGFLSGNPRTIQLALHLMF